MGTAYAHRGLKLDPDGQRVIQECSPLRSSSAGLLSPVWWRPSRSS